MAYRKPGNLKIEYQAKKFLRLSEICDEPLFLSFFQGEIINTFRQNIT